MKDGDVSVVFNTACGERIESAKVWLKNFGGKVCRFVCFSRKKEGQGKEYKISFFHVSQGLIYSEIAQRGACENNWTIEGGGIISYNLMRRCGRNFAQWLKEKFLDNAKKYLSRPEGNKEAEEILTAIEEFCLSGLVDIKFVDSKGKEFNSTHKPNFGEVNLNFVCSLNLTTRIYTATIFIRVDDFPHSAIVDRIMCNNKNTEIIGGGAALVNSKTNNWQVIWGAASSLIDWGHPERPDEKGLANQILKEISIFLND
jgi:hypothetical protein